MFYLIIFFMSFPLKLLGIYYFVRKTNKKKIDFTSNDYIEIILTLSVATWVYLYYYLTAYDEANQYLTNDPSTYSGV